MTSRSDTRPDDLPHRAGLSGGWLTLIFVAVVGVGAAIALVGGDPSTAEMGGPAPPFVVETFGGERFDLGAHLAEGGGPVVLNLWASWCAPCREEFPLLSEFAERRPDVTVVGVAVRDRRQAAAEFAEEMDPSFPVGFDEDGTVEQSYPSFGLPATYVIGTDGTVEEVFAGRLTADSLEGLVPTDGT